MLSLLITSITFGQIPGVIGIKFAFTGGYATSDDLAPTDQAGVVAVTNWNNLQANIPGGGSVAQRVAAEDVTWNINQDSAGNTLSGVTLTAGGFDDGWYNGGNECANGRLLYDVWKINSGAYSQAGFNGQFEDGAGKQYATCTINNLPGAVYDVYVYINDNNGNYWGNAGAGTVFAVGNNPDSDGFNGADSDPCDVSPQMHTAGGYNNPVDYVKMAHVATSSGSITVTITEQGGEMGVAGIELVPASDITLEQDTAPDHAETVAGDQVIFEAAYSNTPPVNLQWVNVSSGVTNTINTGIINVTNNGVVTSTLTLNNVQAGTSTYQLEAINANNSADVAYSDAASLSVGSSPTPTNNIIVDYAGQDGPVTFYPPNWTVNTNIDLIADFPLGSGVDTLSAEFGDFTGSGGGGANSDPEIMDDGTPGAPGSDATIKNQLNGCGPASQNGDFAGGYVVYTLSTNLGAPYGFDLTNITVYGGWTDSGRNEQDYQVLYSTVQDPTNFVALLTEDYTPADPNGSASENRTTLIPATGVLAHNVYAVEFNFVTSIYPHNGWEGYSQLVVEGPSSAGLFPVLVQDINPLTAEDVVGSSITMTAAFASGTVQWQDITGGVTNNVNTGVVNVTNNGIVYSTLTVTPLTLSSAGNYRATASGSGGFVTSSSCQVTVEPAPAAVGNVVTAWASQGSDVLPFGPTWSTNELTSSLIYQQDPPSGGTGSGDFSAGGTDGGLPVLTDGNYGEITPASEGHLAFADCGAGAGQYVIYTMPDSAANGDDITNIQIAGGWNDNGRNTQQYTVYYSTVADPTNFVLLTSVSNSPDTSESEIRATFTPASGILAGNVAQIYVDFTTPPGVPNGWSGYSKISVFGKASATRPPSPVAPALRKSNLYSGGNLIVSGTGGSANAPYTLLTTTNLLIPLADWTPVEGGTDGNGQTITTGELDGSGAFSNAIPVNVANPASFFVLKVQ